MKMTRLKFGALVLVMGLIGGWLFWPMIRPDPREDRLLEAERRWAEVNIMSYRMQVTGTCGAYCSMHRTWIVRNGRLEQASSRDQEAHTVPGVFANIRRLLEWEQQFGRSECLSVNYDPQYGYPTQVVFDCENAIDEEWILNVLEFEVLP